ncbi:hypothetical protein [Prescottella agglutinans]|uniref:Uncharacterized protein n=1 Tax=Prescottella agglutinans TaxID=1644129 RepID=A0ABT6MLD2_9NOCA|nr:hypothetical protein [Prescottella agglutinans]MDH6284684.1 hypothetical protein [Prescottella agglutinans]
MNGDIQTITLSAHEDDIDADSYAHVADYDRTAALVLVGCQRIEGKHGARITLTKADARALGQALLDWTGR